MHLCARCSQRPTQLVSTSAARLRGSEPSISPVDYGTSAAFPTTRLELSARAHPTLAASLKLSTGAGFRPGCSLPAALPSTASIRAASHPATDNTLRIRPAPPHTSRASHGIAAPCPAKTAAARHPPRTPNRTSSCQQQIPQVAPRRRGLATARPAREAAAPAYDTTLRTSANAAGPCGTLRGFLERIWSW